MHGLAYTFIYATASIYLDRFCDSSSRSGAHQFFAVITSGIGSFAGNLFCGFMMDACTGGGGTTVDYHRFWLAPVAGVGALFVALLIFLRYLPQVRRESSAC